MLSKEHYCYKIHTLTLMKSSVYPPPPPLYGLPSPSPTPFSQENLDPPSYNFLKIPTPHINEYWGDGGVTLWSIFTAFIFVTWKGVFFFSNNAKMYEIDHCARWELVFTFYSMIFIDLSYWIQVVVCFCTKERSGFGGGWGVR